MRLVQITDPHIGAAWTTVDPRNSLRAVIAAVKALPDRPDGVLVTGDLAADGSDAQYAALVPLLDELELPYVVLPGNHDDRAALRRHFELPGDGPGRAPTSTVIRWPPMRVLMLDTTVPGADGGDIDALCLEWIDAVLGADGDHVHPTLIAMHHPPFHCGVRAMDRIALAPGAADALARILARHPQVVGTIAGHHHRMITTMFAGRPAIIAPSTYAGLPLDFAADTLRIVPDPIGFVVHTLVDGQLVSHLQSLPALVID